MTQPFGDERVALSEQLRTIAGIYADQQTEPIGHCPVVTVGKRRLQLLGDTHDLRWSKPQDIFWLRFLSRDNMFCFGVLQDGTLVETGPVVRSRNNKSVRHRTLLGMSTYSNKWQVIPIDWMSREYVYTLNRKLTAALNPSSSARAD